MHSYGLCRWGRHVQKDRILEESSKAYSWKPDFRLVCSNRIGHQAHSWLKNSPLRFENSKHIHDLKWRNQDWRLWNCLSSSTHIRLCKNCNWNSLLLVARNLLRTALQSKIRHLVSWLHPLWDGYFASCLWRKQYERISDENYERNLPWNSKELQRKHEEPYCWHAY